MEEAPADDVPPGDSGQAPCSWLLPSSWPLPKKEFNEWLSLAAMLVPRPRSEALGPLRGSAAALAAARAAGAEPEPLLPPSTDQRGEGTPAPPCSGTVVGSGLLEPPGSEGGASAADAGAATSAAECGRGAPPAPERAAAARSAVRLRTLRATPRDIGPVASPPQPHPGAPPLRRAGVSTVTCEPGKSRINSDCKSSRRFLTSTNSLPPDAAECGIRGALGVGSARAASEPTAEGCDDI